MKGGGKLAQKHETSGEQICHIRVKGRLDEKWAEWFDGFAMASRGNGDTLLSGPALDQAALQGTLDRIHNLGLPLRLVVQTECPCSKKGCPYRGQCQECAARHSAKNGLPFCLRERSRWDKRCTQLLEAR
jgi:hypothetical protein